MTSRLDEVKFSDLTDLGDTLRKYQGKGFYVHFSRQNKRLGINTKTIHGDPKGVYFYPVDWLLESHRFHKGDQWGTNMPYYFICAIDFSRPGVNLDTLTLDEAQAIGERNGWWKQFTDVSSFPNDIAPGQVSKAFWAFLRGLNSASSLGGVRMSWAQSLKGECWVKDTSGIIMIYEPSQVCVMDPRCMRLIESGQQPELSEGNSDTFKYWKRVVMQVMTTLARDHGGEVKWMRGVPSMLASGKDWSFALKWDRQWAGVQLVAETQMGRAHERHTVTWKELKSREVPEIVERIEEWLVACENYDGNDLKFEPHLSREDASNYLKSQFIGLDEHEINWDIGNSIHMMWAEVNRTAGMPPVTTMARLGVDDDSAWLRLDLKINNRLLLSVNNAPLKDFSAQFWNELAPDCLGKLRADLEEADMWDVFLGWLGHYSGLVELEPFEEQFFNCKEKRELYGLLDPHFSRLYP